MRPQIHQSVPGARLTLDVDPAAFPYRFQVGDQIIGAWPEKYMRGSKLCCRAWVVVPPLGKGRHDLLIHDKHGVHPIGHVQIM